MRHNAAPLWVWYPKLLPWLWPLVLSPSLAVALVSFPALDVAACVICRPGCGCLRRLPPWLWRSRRFALVSRCLRLPPWLWPLASSPALAGSLQQNKYSIAGYICTVVCFCVIALITSERAGRCRAVGSAKRSWCDTEVFTCHSRCEWAWLPWPPPIDLF